ncbi:MAG: FecR domain-containing protein [Bacteroidaceae bacterium]|nr:FecR domain-containing protein [Bacteroidaceae bacterium]
MISLLLKSILGTLTPEEDEALRAWREADEAHERLYRQTTDEDFLQREYARRQAVNVARPLAEMQARIGRVRPFYRRPAFLRVAAVVAFVLLTGVFASLYLYNNMREANVAEAFDIRAGEMRATLTYPDGRIVELDGSLPAPAPSLTTNGTSDASGRPRTEESEDGAASTLALVTPRGGEFRITLEDGTEVWLNAQSRLVYPETFSGPVRRVRVEGEAYFKVARDEQHPFQVEADGLLVSVLGTEFNLRNYAEDTTVQTTLVSGSIAMQPVGAGNAQLQLTPGHQAIFDKAEHNINVQNIDTEVVTGWKDGKFVFENQTLRQIMLTLSRWYDFDYEFLDEAAADTEFMGRIPRYGDFADVIAILKGSGGLKVSVKGKLVRIGTLKD